MTQQTKDSKCDEDSKENAISEKIVKEDGLNKPSLDTRSKSKKNITFKKIQKINFASFGPQKSQVHIQTILYLR